MDSYKTVDKQLEFKQATMELLENYWSSSDEVNLQDLKSRKVIIILNFYLYYMCWTIFYQQL